MQLINRGLENTVASSLGVSSGDNLQSITDIDYQRSRPVRHVVPLLVAAPYLQTGDGNREQQSCQTEVCVSVHTQTFRCLLGFFLDRSEECVAEAAFASRASVGLDVVPEIVIRELQDTGKQS